MLKFYDILINFYATDYNFVIFVTFTFIISITNKRVHVFLNRQIIDQEDRRSFRNEIISLVDIPVIEQR